MNRATPTTRPRQPSRQRGSVYLAVLGASMLIATLGVSALHLVRVQTRINEGANNALRASAAANSMIEVVRGTINNIAWRSTHTNDTWVADTTFGIGKITYKFVDERDGNLANSSTQPVRLYGKATFGKAVRLLSVELVADNTGKMSLNPGSFRQEVLP